MKIRTEEEKAVLRQQDAARKRIERAVSKPSPVSEFWLKNEKEFALADEPRWAELFEKNLDLEATKIELDVAMDAFDRGQPISEVADVLPDQTYSEIVQTCRKDGQLSYQTIEAAPVSSEGYRDFRSAKFDGSAESAYRNFGMRLCLTWELERDARNFLIVYAADSKDPGLNPEIIQAAINTFDNGVGRYSDRARDSIWPKAAPAKAESYIPTQSPHESPNQQEARRYKTWAEAAHGKGGIFEGRE
jgi:hypothetical protein